MLTDLIMVETKELEWKLYNADILGLIANRLFAWSGIEDVDIPLYTDLNKPEEKPKSAESIKGYIVGKLLHGKEVEK